MRENMLGISLVDGDVALVMVFVFLDFDTTVEGVVGIVATGEAVFEVTEDCEIIAEMLDRSQLKGHLVIPGSHLRMEIRRVHSQRRSGSKESHWPLVGFCIPAKSG